MRVRSFIFIAMLLLSGITAYAQTPPPPPLLKDLPHIEPCDQTGPVYWVWCQKIKFYDKITPDGKHPGLVVGSVAPGSGLTGGVGYKHDFRGSLHPNFVTSARVSIRKYWELDANLRLNLISKRHTKPIGVQDTKINIYGFVKDMPRLDFFGLGPESRQEDRAVFHYREAVAGGDVVNGINLHLDLGGAAEVIWPHIVRITNPTTTSVERKFSEATAPGIDAQPPFIHLVAFARVKSPEQPEGRRLDYLFLYHVYQDVGEQRYSFRRFNADLRNKFPLGRQNEIRIRGRVGLSETSEGQRVPFYLMETLGGSNIRGDDTLRGFRDYRFRDRDYLLVQTEFLHRLYSYIHLIMFYDFGKVAPSVSRFGDGRMRQTYGAGFVIVPRQLDNILFRFYVALGSGEGSHTYFNGGLPGRGDRLTR
jgi:hypothetical protein